MIKIQAVEASAASHRPFGRGHPGEPIGSRPPPDFLGWFTARSQIGDEGGAGLCRQEGTQQVVGVPPDSAPVADERAGIDADLHARARPAVIA
jgi:hypothetical protein